MYLVKIEKRDWKRVPVWEEGARESGDNELEGGKRSNNSRQNRLLLVGHGRHW